ncbi:MAG: histidine--tRNA ligase [bacterium]|nr:histidine--tRNA ligase [bacterium]
MAKQKPIQSIKGMHDILPADQPYWQFVYKKFSNLVGEYGFEKIDTPLIESSSLFLRSVGDDTDIVSKEMYSFKSRGGEELALRPENTASVVRAYIEHGMSVWPHPVKLWYWGPMFRHDQPQAGRYRQFHQAGVEIFGDEHPASDAEAMFVALGFLEGIGLKNLMLRINSIGCPNCRPSYIKALKEYFKNRGKNLCPTCKIRQKTNILRVLDCKELSCKEILKDIPQFVDYLDESCRDHFKKVIEFLDEVKAPYSLDPLLVRGLDYYTQTVFEISLEENTVATEGVESVSTPGLTLIAGGRYNGLVELLGGSKTPAVGWAAGIERIILELKRAQVKMPEMRPAAKIFLAQLGDLGKRKSLVLFEEFRRAGIIAGISLGRDSIKAQLRIANRLKVRLALILGQKEALDGTVILREMDSGIQEVIPVEGIVEVVKKRLRS